nr:MAG TPA: POLLEN ALLERGEN 5 ALLERGEN, SMALL HIGHLY DISULFIDE [Caudoviricetes sp.]
MPPIKCQKCEDGSNCINGRYCHPLHRYVEYEPKALCDKK